MPLFVILIVCWPLIEIAGFIYVGEIIGILPTIGLTLFSMFFGAALLRVQGTAVLRKMQAELQARRVPATELGHGAFITLAGFCLLVPGFVSDIIGLLLFLPPVRFLLLSLLVRNLKVVVRTHHTSRVVDLGVEEWHEGSVETDPHSATRGSGGPKHLGGPRD